MVEIPPPKQGLVIRYSYLWHRESVKGQEEGRKDRPCSVVAATKDGRVAVVPITTSKPDADTPALELPAAIGKQLGLGDRPSWIIANEANVFRWPGEDIRPATRDSWAFGQLPPNFTKAIVQNVRQQVERTKMISRDQPLSSKDWKRKSERSGEIKKAPTPKGDRDRSR